MSDTIKIVAALVVIAFIAIVGLNKLSSGNAFSWSFFTSKFASETTIDTRLDLVTMQGNDARLYTFSHPTIRNTTCSSLVTSEGASLSCMQHK